MPFYCPISTLMLQALTVQIYSLHSAIFSSKALPLGYCLLLIIVVFENVEIETLLGNSNFF